MKISLPDSKSTPGPDGSAGVGPAGAGAKQQPAQAAPNDRAQLSNLSSYLASALAGSPAHVAKLSELGTAVSSEQYKVDAYVVSGSIIQHGIEFGGAHYPAVTD
jgi:hypothetical protein